MEWTYASFNERHLSTIFELKSEVTNLLKSKAIYIFYHVNTVLQSTIVGRDLFYYIIDVGVTVINICEQKYGKVMYV